MNDQWKKLSPLIRGTSLIAGEVVHVLNEQQTHSWCGMSKGSLKEGDLFGGDAVNCPACIEKIVAKFHPMLQKRKQADVSEYIGKTIQLHQEEEQGQHCPKCKSHRITGRFGSQDGEGSRFDHAHDRYEPMDSEDYHIHHDTLVCLDCKFWDYPSAFDNAVITVYMECAVDKRETKQYQSDWDSFSGVLDLVCSECQCSTSLSIVSSNTFRIQHVRV